MSDEHVCYFGVGRSPQGYDHPLPPEDPARLQGPEVGTVVRYKNERYPRWDGMLVMVEARSYVWSPGECRSKGGYRHYDWTVIRWPQLNTKGGIYWSSMVVNDTELVTP